MLNFKILCHVSHQNYSKKTQQKLSLPLITLSGYKKIGIVYILNK